MVDNRSLTVASLFMVIYEMALVDDRAWKGFVKGSLKLLSSQSGRGKRSSLV